MDMKSIETNLLTGKKVPNRDLIRAVEFFGALADNLADLGPRWHFAFGEANRLYVLCRSYARARGLIPKP